MSRRFAKARDYSDDAVCKLMAGGQPEAFTTPQAGWTDAVALTGACDLDREGQYGGLLLENSRSRHRLPGTVVPEMLHGSSHWFGLLQPFFRRSGTEPGG